MRKTAIGPKNLSSTISLCTPIIWKKCNKVKCTAIWCWFRIIYVLPLGRRQHNHNCTNSESNTADLVDPLQQWSHSDPQSTIQQNTHNNRRQMKTKARHSSTTFLRKSFRPSEIMLVNIVKYMKCLYVQSSVQVKVATQSKSRAEAWEMNYCLLQQTNITLQKKEVHSAYRFDVTNRQKIVRFIHLKYTKKSGKWSQIHQWSKAFTFRRLRRSQSPPMSFNRFASAIQSFSFVVS